MTSIDDLAGIGKLADSKVINALYRDGLSKAAIETGNTLGDLAKTFRLFLAPIQLLAVAQDRLASFCDRVRSSVPPERQIEASASIAAPVLFELRYMEDGNPITNLYLNLLRRAIDRDRVAEAHPAFAKLIGQLCPDEALLLHHLNKAAIQLVEYHYPLHEGAGVHQVAWSDCPIVNLQTSMMLSIYLSHLESLDLVVYAHASGPRNHDVPDLAGYMTLPSCAKLSPFGRLFVQACEP